MTGAQDALVWQEKFLAKMPKIGPSECGASDREPSGMIHDANGGGLEIRCKSASNGARLASKSERSGKDKSFADKVKIGPSDRSAGKEDTSGVLQNADWDELAHACEAHW